MKTIDQVLEDLVREHGISEVLRALRDAVPKHLAWLQRQLDRVWQRLDD